MNTLRTLSILAIALMLGGASCESEQSLVGAPPDPTPDEPPIVLTTLDLLTSSPQLQSDGATPVTLSALIKNANNQIVAGIPVTFSASSGTLVVLEGTTNAQGLATAELSTTGNPTNRTISVTATAQTVESTIDIAVIGSALQIQGPTSLVSGTTGEYTITLLDAAGKGISGETVELSSSNGNALSASSLTTDINGRIVVELTGTTSGSDTLSATALADESGNPTVTATIDIDISADNFRFTAPDSGDEVVLNTPATITVRWETEGGAPEVSKNIRFATTRGTLTPNNINTNTSGDASVQIQSDTAGPATITATTDDDTSTQIAIEFVANVPDQISLQADPGVIGPEETSVITAIVEDVDNNRVKNATVEFTLTDTTGGALSIASAVTDSQGRAQTVYTASSAPSADDGVEIIGQVVGTALQSNTFLTVAGRPLFIVFGTGNQIIEDDEDTTYTKDYSLFVSDSSGAAVANSDVSLRVIPTRYFKGNLTLGATAWTQNINAICTSEDLNTNGTLDTTPVNEDLNLDEELTPGNVAVIAPGSVTTDENGQARFQIIYPQNYAMWLEARITVSATVAGTESRKSQTFRFPASADDLDINSSPPNTISPWGISASCFDTL